MRKRLLFLLAVFTLLIPVCTVTASADCGPKPSTVVYINRTDFDDCVITLLAREEGNGPYRAVEEGKENPEKEDIRREAWQAFAAYEDPDGFYFWGETFIPMVNWSYYPPEVFKVAVYFPETDVLLVSQEIFERYAFESKFALDLDHVDKDQSGIVSMKLEKEVNWPAKIGEFFLRVAVTLAIELLVAFVWGYRSKRQVKVLLMVNLVTQVILNVMLSLWYIFDGPLSAMLRLMEGEIVVLIVESVSYVRRLPERSGKATGANMRAFCYALTANLLSCYLGWKILDWLAP